MTLKEAKLNYLANKNRETYQELCNALQTSEVFLVMDWDLTSEEEKRFENVEIGDTVHVETQMMPLILGTSMSKPAMVAYSEESVIPENVKKKFAVMRCDAEYLHAIYKAFKKALKMNLRIILDLNAEPVLISDKELQYHA